jgi:hypothetical protein
MWLLRQAKYPSALQQALSRPLEVTRWEIGEKHPKNNKIDACRLGGWGSFGFMYYNKGGMEQVIMM